LLYFYETYKMAKGKQFKVDKLDETLDALNKVAPKPKTSINLRELIRGLKPKIKRLRSWKYDWAEIVELLKEQGIEIAEDTLKEYLKTPRRKTAKSPKEKALLSGSNNYKKDEQAIDNKELKLEPKSESVVQQEPQKVEMGETKPRRKLKENSKDESNQFNF